MLKNTEAPAMLVECCFVTDKDDVELYNHYKMAKAIVKGITGTEISVSVEMEEDTDEEAVETPVSEKKELLRVQVGAYAVPENAEKMKARLLELGFDAIIVET